MNTKGKEGCNVEVDRTMEDQHITFSRTIAMGFLDTSHSQEWTYFTKGPRQSDQWCEEAGIYHGRSFVGNHVHKCFKILWWKWPQIFVLLSHDTEFTVWDCMIQIAKIRMYFCCRGFLRWAEYDIPSLQDQEFTLRHYMYMYTNTSQTIGHMWITEIRISQDFWQKWSASQNFCR